MVSIGLGASLAVLAFKEIIKFVHELLFGKLGSLISNWGAWTVMLMPVIGGLIVGLMRQFLVPVERHHGVAGIMESVALAGGRLRYGRVPLKSIAAAVSIGSGASVGPEDPSVQIGANLGSFIGQKLRLSADRTRLLVAMGAASGIAAAFNAPIAGVFFAIELILGELTTSAFGMVVFSAVISAVTTRAILGPTPAFPIPAYDFHAPVELIFYLILGLLAAVVSVAYIQAIYRAHDWFHHSKLPLWARPALIGALVGAVGIVFPEIFGDSYEAITEILFGRMIVAHILLILLVLKIILTSLSLGSGFMGGVFAPSLFLGAALGGAFGRLADSLFPTLIIQPSAFALVGMAAVRGGGGGGGGPAPPRGGGGGGARGRGGGRGGAAPRGRGGGGRGGGGGGGGPGPPPPPPTAIMLLFEMTNDYRILLPLMFAVVVSVFLSRSIHAPSVYELSLLRKGIRLQRGQDIDVLETLRVREAMRAAPEQVQANMPLRMVSALLEKTRHHGLPVVNDDGSLCGIISLTDIDRAVEQNEKNLDRPAAEFCSRRLVVAYPDETVREALQRMSGRDIGRMPVVEPEDQTRLAGWLNRADIIRAYELALSRRSADRHRVGQVQLGAISGAEVMELIVAPGSPVDGVMLKDIHLPHNSLVASLQRGRRLMIPHGGTRLHAGDRLALVAEAEDREALRQMIEADED
jgi:CIC family chloride channel protein